MRIVPLVLITVGVVALLRHYGVIDPAFFHLFWPIAAHRDRRRHCSRAAPLARRMMRRAHEDRWERRMHRHFGPGWANLSEEERERFRAGMRQWRSHDRRARRQFIAPNDPRTGARHESSSPSP